jgi:truncated hemoglobin YjbI/ankyrin repeat protein
MPFVGGMRGVSPETDVAMPKKQVTAGKKARAAARGGEKYTTALRRQLAPGAGPGAESYVSGMNPAHLAGLGHRSLLDYPPGFRPFRGTDLFERIGGQPAIDRLVDLLYEGIEDDEQLRPLFPRGLAGGRSMQKLFFAEWLGGPARYSEQAHAGLGHRHDGLPITPALASRWLGHFRRAIEATVAAENDRGTIFAQVRSLAMVLVSGQVAPARPPGRGSKPGGKDAPGSESKDSTRQVAWCGIGARSVREARDLARRGDAAGLGAALAEAPDLLRPTYAASIMQAAALAGRAEIVRMLLDRGAGADHPFYLPVGVTGVAFERVVFVTPLCAARMKRRPAVESLLIAAGASEDVFTSAFLGDLTSLAQLLAADPGLAQATDPAVDVLDITPADHAVAGGQASALRLILDHVAPPLPGGTRALRGAAAQGSLAMAELLLAHGADASRIGVGRWVLHPELAPLLARRGAAIDSSGSWIGASCTGNQGRKDDPEYVRALLRHGARANDRRTGDPEGTTGVRALNATALHYAAKAGFLQTIEVLIDHGANPGARDSHGRTPLDWLEQAAPSVSRAAVRNLLASEQRR